MIILNRILVPIITKEGSTSMNPNTQKGLKIVAAVITVAIAAQVTVDVGSIPITGQTLAVLAWAFFLSYKESLAAISIYVLIGVLGFPVFADGASGFEKLVGGSGGYLIGFIAAAGVVSYLFSILKPPSLLKVLGLTALGTIIILVFGVGRLMTLYGVEKGIEYGLLPFWKGALIKIVLGTIVVWTIDSFLQKRATT